jgi:hypothetical protein
LAILPPSAVRAAVRPCEACQLRDLDPVDKKAAARHAGSGFFNIVNGFLNHAASKAWRRPTLPLLKQ